MENKKSLEDLMEIPYVIKLSKKDDRYTALLAELVIVASGNSPTEAITNIDQKKRKVFENFLETDSISDIPQPLLEYAARDIKNNEYKYLALRTLIVAAVTSSFIGILIFGGISIGVSYLSMAAGNGPSSAERLMNISRHVSMVPIERKNAIVKELRFLVKELKPFVDELRPIFLIDPKTEATKIPLK